MICGVECRQQICDDCTFFEKWYQTVAVYTKQRVLGPRQNPEEPHNEASFVKRLNHWCWQDWNLSDKYDKNHSKALPDVTNTSCKRVRRMLWSIVLNAADKLSKVRKETWPSSALPRRQFVMSKRAVSVLWCAWYADWKVSERLLANRWPQSWCSTNFSSTLERNGTFDTGL